VEFVKFNDLADLEAKFDGSVCAIVMETIQGEGGIYPVSETFWKRARELATQRDAAMIADEIQCGLGRTGRAFAYQKFAGAPDIVVICETVGGRRAARRDAGERKFCVRVGAGNARHNIWRRPAGLRGLPLEFLNVMEDEKLLANVRERGRGIARRIGRAGEKAFFHQRIRGEGLMVGVQLSVEGAPYVAEALRNRVLIIARTKPRFGFCRRIL